MKRRAFITLLGGAALAWLLAARAQEGQRDKQIRIGFLAAAVPTAAMLRAFRDALREHGYVEGQNLSIADRWPQGSSEQISDIAAELVRSNVDIIVAWTTPASLAAKAATATIPIVIVGVGDSVGTGLVRSLARPGGNITGFVNLAPDLGAKQAQLLVEVIPEIRRVGIVRNPSNPAVTVALREVENAIRVLGLESHTVDARLPQEFESAFARLSAEGVKGVIVFPDASVIEHRRMIAALAQKTRLPTMFQRRENVTAGGLMSYGPDLPDQLRQAAFYVDRILERYQTGRPASPAGNQDRAGDQPKDRKSSRPDHTPDPAGPRRRGDRMMRRREFITVLGGAAAAWPFVARAQQRDRLRWVAVVMQYLETDPQGQLRAAAFREGLEKAGWVSGRNISVDYLWGVMDSEWIRGITEHLRQQVPDVIAINSSIGLRAIESTAPGVPIVFIAVSEPVAQGFVASLAHPGGNITGFSNLEPTLGAKWLDLLKRIAPQATRIAFIYNRSNPGAKVTLQSIQSAAGQFSFDVLDMPVRDLAEIEAGIAGLAREPGGALLVPPDPFTMGHRKRIVELTASDQLPLISAVRSFADEGGLLAYGVYIPELFRQAASYVDRILRGEKPSDLPVQSPTRFELVINLKTAKALGLTVPPTLIAVADEVIE